MGGVAADLVDSTDCGSADHRVQNLEVGSDCRMERSRRMFADLINGCGSCGASEV